MHTIFVKNAELFCKIVLRMLYNSKNNYFKLYHFLIHKEFFYYDVNDKCKEQKINIYLNNKRTNFFYILRMHQLLKIMYLMS